ncbi:MAG: YggT family protein [Candidatus Omnitrophica bacterium]|nr:YggT family protein [Candidatus Omnitrophota bacterium]
MFILANFLIGLAEVLRVLLTILWWLILIRAIISWVNPDPFNPIVQFLHHTTEPILYPLRKIIPPAFGIDISPFIAFLLIVFLKSFLVNSLIGIALRIK